MNRLSKNYQTVFLCLLAKETSSVLHGSAVLFCKMNSTTWKLECSQTCSQWNRNNCEVFKYKTLLENTFIKVTPHFKGPTKKWWFQALKINITAAFFLLLRNQSLSCRPTSMNFSFQNQGFCLQGRATNKWSEINMSKVKLQFNYCQ